MLDRGKRYFCAKSYPFAFFCDRAFFRKKAKIKLTVGAKPQGEIMNNLLATYPIDFLTDTEDGNGMFGGAISVAAFVTLCVLAVVVIADLIVFFAARKYAKKTVGYSFIAFTAYALLGGILLLCLKIAKDSAKKRLVQLVFIPVLVTLILCLISGVCLFVLYKKNSRLSALMTKILGGVCGVSLVVTLILIAVHFSTGVSGDGYYTADGSNFSQAGLYVSAALLIAAAIAAAFLLDKKKEPFDSRTISYAGICIALSFALSYIKLFRLPQGGSVTLLSMLPIMIFAYAFGLKKGLLIGLIYGILQSVQDPYIIHPAQFLLDYPIAYTMIGLTGLFAELKPLKNVPQVKFALGAVVAGTLRFTSHVFSGVFAFGAYAIDAGATNFWAYSLAYNSVVFVDLALAVVAGVILFSSKAFRSALKLDAAAQADKTEEPALIADENE